MFLYRIQPVRLEVLKGGASEFEASKISEHFSYLKQLTEKGIVFLAGRTTNTDYSSFGIVILKAASEDVARDIMNSDPAVKSGVFRSELFPYSVALFNDKARE
jgi:uncharacterized protein YciI